MTWEDSTKDYYRLTDLVINVIWYLLSQPKRGNTTKWKILPDYELSMKKVQRKFTHSEESMWQMSRYGTV